MPIAHTHLAVDRGLVGEPLELAPGRARARLATTHAMAADDRGLVHGGFVFGLADFAAMLAVDEPNVVLASAECRFLAPVVAGEVVEATAERITVEGNRHRIRVVVTRGETRVFEGELVAAVPSRHVLDRRPGGGS
ncbi:MAG TPA: hotdog domain-containing protein [Thermoanaerobaculia bacterium]|nr:hotdog domain-containing protein [Thermoanaerobaculia bacterium]